MNFKNVTSLVLLMVISELLLAAFVMWWLVVQFNEEEISLKKNLTEVFNKSRDQVIDSVLIKKLINPVLHEGETHKIEILVGKDSVPDSLMMITKHFAPDRYYREEKIKHERKGLVPQEIQSDSEIHTNVIVRLKHDSTDNLLLHGVKLIVNEISNAPGEKRKMQEAIYGNADTVLFKKLLSANFQKNGWHFSSRWISGISKSTAEKESAPLYFESDLFPYPYGVQISGYFSFLLKKIVPQCVFALILLSLMGAAFIIACRSLKNQIHLNTLKDDFISNISHELKTPVSTVKVALEALQNPEVRKNENVSTDYLRMASLETDRLEQLIGQVLNTFLMESGTKTMAIENVNMHELVDEVIASFRLRFLNEKASLTFQHPQEALLAGLDRLSIQGVLINLLDNCLKYADKPAEISIDLSTAEDKILLRISDNGPGIPLEYLDRVFEKFFRVPTGNRHNVKGYGLGLTYAAETMKRHSGQIKIQNLAAGGCAFTLVLPKAL